MEADVDPGAMIDESAVRTARDRAERARRAALAASAAAAAAEEAVRAAEVALAESNSVTDDSATTDPATTGPAPTSPVVEDDPVVEADDDTAVDDDDDTAVDDDEPDGATPADAAPAVGLRARGHGLLHWLRSHFAAGARRRTIGALVVLALIAGGVGASLWMYSTHRDHVAAENRRAAYVQAASQAVVNMTSIDFEHAEADVQRVLDAATGEFRDDFDKRGPAFVEVIRKSRVATDGKIGLAGVERVGPDGSMVVLVASNSTVSNAAGAQNEDRAWRLRVTVVPVDGDLKISKVEFVP